MRTLDFGQDLPTSSRSVIISPKNKGDKITFVIAQPPSYVGKHFVPLEEGGWDVTTCPRVNNPEDGVECKYCTKFFEIYNEAQEAKKKGDKEAYEALNKEARKYRVSLQFYFPILDRNSKQFKVLQTTIGVRNKIDEYYRAGIDIMKSEFVLTNTGSESPRDVYSLIRKDSADVKPFDEEEKEEYKKARGFDMNTLSSYIEGVDRDEVKTDPDLEDIASVAQEIFAE